MLRVNENRRAVRGGKRGFLVTVTVLGTLLALAGPASAQSPCGVSAVDQYVECIPTGDGENSSGANQSSGGSLPPSVANAIQSAGGEDAQVLEQVATSSRYGAPKPTDSSSDSSSRHGRISGDALAAADPDSDVSTGDAASAVVSAVQGGDAGRLVGLLVGLFLISAAALTVAALRQKQRTSP
jgi:hypothetical protein